MTVAKLNQVLNGSIPTVNGVSASAISKVNGVSWALTNPWRIENFNNLDFWRAPVVGGDGVVEQVTFDSQETCHFVSSGASGATKLWQHWGYFDNDRYVIEIKLYVTTLGVIASGDYIQLTFGEGVLPDATDWSLLSRIGTDGIFVYDGASLLNTGGNVLIDDWTTIKYDCDISGGAASATADVTVNSILEADDIDVSRVNAGTYGWMIIDGEDDTEFWVDYVSVQAS
jgi:hypothetical protein